MIDRRTFLAGTLAGGFLTVSRSAEAQQLKLSTIGVLVVGAPSSEKFWRMFHEAMRELGYVEGKTVRFEFRSDQGQAGRLPELAGGSAEALLTLVLQGGGPYTAIRMMKPREALRRGEKPFRMTERTYRLRISDTVLSTVANEWAAAQARRFIPFPRPE